jgi:DNA modification methylase
VGFRLIQGDCLDAMPALESESVDSIVTDPPYGLSFMGKDWDHGVPGEHFWREAIRVAKPGAHLLAFGGTRMFHRLAVAIEDAGWEIRDTVMWVYGSGFPKSLDVSKAIDKAAGAEGAFGEPKTAAHAGWIDRGRMRGGEGHEGWQRPCMADKQAVERSARQYIPATIAGKQWAGWGTALKPAWEPIIVARKPLIGTVADNVLKHGTGAMNIDGCRVGAGNDRASGGHQGSMPQPMSWGRVTGHNRPTGGRWPANLIHDGSDEVVGLFPAQTSGANPTRRGSPKFRNAFGEFTGQEECTPQRGAESGSAARFFYCAKASKADRDEGCEELPQSVQQSVAHGNKKYGTLPYTNEPREIKPRPRSNHHPTVKPTDLMRYLCRLVTPPSGVVLDPFMGSGSTGKAAILEGFQFIGIEREAEYLEIAKARIDAAEREPRGLF